MMKSIRLTPTEYMDALVLTGMGGFVIGAVLMAAICVGLR